MMTEAATMEDQENRESLRRQLIIWSEAHEAAASRLAEQHRDLLVTGHLAVSQLYGLSSIAQSTEELGDVLKFVKHQGEKAARGGHEELAGFWDNLGKQLSTIEQEASTIAMASGLELPPQEGRRSKKAKAALNPVSTAMAREWLQHLVAHSLLLAVQAGSEE